MAWYISRGKYPKDCKSHRSTGWRWPRRTVRSADRADHKEHSSVMHNPRSSQNGHCAHSVVEVILDHGPQHGQATVRCQQRSQVHVGAVVKEKMAKDFDQGEDLRRSHHGSSRLRVRRFVTICLGPLVLNQASRKKQAKQVTLSKHMSGTFLVTRTHLLDSTCKLLSVLFVVVLSLWWTTQSSGTGP